jgi:general stress protein YciG
MTNHHKKGHGFSGDLQKVNDAGRKGNTAVNLKVELAEKARVGGQQSHAGIRAEATDKTASRRS